MDTRRSFLCVACAIPAFLPGVSSSKAQNLSLTVDLKTDRSLLYTWPFSQSGTEAVFSVRASESPLEGVWRTQGTPATTTEVAIPAGLVWAGSFGSSLVLRPYFSRQPGIWLLDPSTGEMRTASTSLVLYNMDVIDGSLYVVDVESQGRWTMWRLDPSVSSTFHQVPNDAAPSPGGALLDGVYYKTGLGVRPGERSLWACDLATETARRVVETMHNVYYLSAVGSMIVWMESDGSGTYVLGRYDPSTGIRTTFSFPRVPATDIGPSFAAIGRYFVVAVAPQPSGGASQTLVELDPATGTMTVIPANIDPQYFFHASATSDTLYFPADSSALGRELYRLCRDSSGIELVGEVAPGAPGFIGDPRVLAGKVWFPASDGAHGWELWVHDPADGSLRMTKDVRPRGDSNPVIQGAAGSTVLFLADDGVHGREVWRTDGTEAGTYLLRDLQTGTNGSRPSGLTRLGDHVLFGANAESGGPLFAVDASGSNVRSLGPTPTVPPYSTKGYMPTSRALLYRLNRYDQGWQRQIWRTDGTPEGTREIYRYPSSSPVGSCDSDSEGQTATLADRDVVFVGWDCALWKSTGEVGGTASVFAPGSPNAPTDLGGLVACGERAYFVAVDAAHGRELWATDGTPPGTHLALDIVPGPANSNLTNPIARDDMLYFTADSPDGRVLFAYDTISQDLRPLFAAVPGCIFSTTIWPVGDKLVFGLWFESNNAPLRGLWSLDSRTGELHRVSNVWPYAFAGAYYSDMRELRNTGDQLFFTAAPSTLRLREVFVYDARSDQVRRVAPPGMDPGPYDPAFLTTVRGITLFTAADAAHGRELWRTDGTPEGTSLAADLVPGGASSDPQEAVLLGDRLFISCQTLAYGAELFTLPLCLADFNVDFAVTPADLVDFLTAYADGIARADLDDGSSTGTPDGGVTIDDLLYYLLRFEAGC